MKNHLFISAGLLWSLFSMSVHAAGSRGDLLRLGSPDKNIEVCVEEDGGQRLADRFENTRILWCQWHTSI